MFVYRLFGQARQHYLIACDFGQQFWRDIGEVLLERDLHVLAHRQRGKQRPALEQDAPAAAHADILVGIGLRHGAPEHLDLALVRGLQADDRAHQHALAGARPADHADDFAAAHLEVEVFVDRVLAEAVDEAFHYDRVLAAKAFVAAEFASGFVDRHQPHPISVKKTAKKASITITAKMPVTTAMVVRRPTSSEFPLTCMP